jgi:hypothetical protein
MVVWYIFFQFGYVVPRKIWQPFCAETNPAEFNFVETKVFLSLSGGKSGASQMFGGIFSKPFIRKLSITD